MEVEAGDATPRSSAELSHFIPPDQERRPAVPLHEPRRHDPDDARMPGFGAEDNGGIVRLQRLLHDLDRLVENQLVHLLATRIDRLELTRERRGFLRVLREQEPEPVVRIADPAHGVEPRRENKADVGAPQRLAP